MFSDTHFHYKLMSGEWGVDGVETLTTMAQRNCRFALDSGTQADDLAERQAAVEKSIAQMADVGLANKARDFVYFSAGIWPSLDEIGDRENRMKLLRESIEKANGTGAADQATLHRRVVAIGEGGLDHHWNPAGADGRNEADFDLQTFRGERELFQMQLELARELDLPFIIHSRDAYEDTLDCLKKVGYHNGIVHCYSYGIDEARTFLDLGWYIAFGGATTYAKKSKMEDMKALLRFVPDDRLLLETDAPYLTPVPLRGTPNSPVKIEHTYNFIAEARGTSPEVLSDLVDRNIEKLFKVNLG